MEAVVVPVIDQLQTCGPEQAAGPLHQSSEVDHQRRVRIDDGQPDVRITSVEDESAEVAAQPAGYPSEASRWARGESRMTTRQSISSRISSSLIPVGRSQWRFPEAPGQMPRYMQKSFRVKTFSLMAIQTLFVLVIMIFVDTYYMSLNVPDESGVTSKIVLYSVGVLNMLCILFLYCLKDRHPQNYALLALTTILSGIFWGITRTVISNTLGFQIAGIICITMFVAAAISAILTARKIEGVYVVVASMLIGWISGSVINIIVSSLLLREAALVVLGAIGFSFLLICIITLDAGRYLIRCKPDDFMSVIVSMNSTLMVVVSIPFFVLSFCFLHTGDAVLDREDEVTQAAPASASLGRTVEAMEAV